MFPLPLWLTPKLLAVAGVVLFTCAVLAGVYRAGGNGPRAEKAALEASYKAAQAVHKAEDDRKAAESKTLLTTLEVKRDEALRDVAAGWATYHADELRRERERATRQGQKPTPIVSKICGDADKDRRLSDAIQGFRLEARGALEECGAAARASRGDVEPLLVTAGEQAADLVLIKAYVIGIRELNK